MVRYAITTKDNPYDPFKDFSSWFMFDVEKGYNTCDLLARVAMTTELLSEREYNEEVSRAIDEIIKDDFMDKYVKLQQTIPDLTSED